MSRKQRRFAPSYWIRERLLADANEDSRISHAAYRVYRRIFDAYNWQEGQAKCSDSFILDRVPVSARAVKYARKSLIETSRIWIIRKGGRRGTVNLPTLYGIEFYYRGSDHFRDLNGGKQALDFRDTGVTLPDDRGLASLQGVNNGSPSDEMVEVPRVQNGEVPKVQNLHPNLSSKEDDIGAPIGERVPVRDAHGGGAGELKSDDVRRVPLGFAKWRIVHAEYVGKKGTPDEDGDFLLAHLRNVRGSKFTLRCHIDSDDYASIDKAMGIDGEPHVAIGREVMMSTNREGPKTFMRPAPLPWRDVTILDGETLDDGGARIRRKRSSEAHLIGA
ncbi:hypothetical protein [Bradyrhizobium sp. I1.7.5]|uniref:hypothetical protein n=1 Tax=Bradyrhizobium sp. I1.7.5 TaxID=3156363 RepID=UPI003397DD43